jgi:hypothetical protein
MIRRLARSLEIGATAYWTGASAGFAFVSAPLAFHIVEDRDEFALLTEKTLGRLAASTYVSAGVAVVAALTQGSLLRAATSAAAIAAIRYHETEIVPEMTAAQVEMGSLNDVADDDPKRARYQAMHQQSTRVFGAAMLLGIAQLFLAASDQK